ncbi:WecB/TagA/CpsF family glycosyltransferase [Pacificoceanicola onchidii]|uniref:WecB/TagA/CpsF family glycosyltransferase n=1 Tax=Pacificoceanicola onchidii TaxID=2562685 RepID=UPI001F0F883C|nr:WecB/TagA/CpsF family glycosyltransferase [Pacificoceanicola onchidii]
MFLLPERFLAMIPHALEDFRSARPVSAMPLRPVLALPLVDTNTGSAIRDILNGARRTVYFLNAHCANLRARDRAYAAALARASHVLPDGIGVELAARMTGGGLTENLNGTDFTPALLREAAAAGQTVYLFGATPGTAEDAAEKLMRDIPGLRIVGTRDGYQGAQDEAAAVEAINRSGADIVIVAMGVPLQEMWIDRNRAALNAPVVLGVGALFDFLAGKVSRAPEWVRKMNLEWLWRLLQEPRRLAKRYLIGNATFLARAGAFALRQVQPEAAAKRAFDMVGSALLTILLAPLLLLIAGLIRLESPGAALFRQERVGQDGKPFTIFKFRSMYQDAEARLEAVRGSSDRDGLCFKARRDPRVTRLGRILRRTSLDELPQILNVLRGEMSLVGPRPALPSEVAQYPAAARERLKARPGITGLWQVAGRADIGFDKMIDMDLAYVRSRSLIMDLLILSMTARAVIGGRGAY